MPAPEPSSETVGRASAWAPWGPDHRLGTIS
jgi:hypothetical protein